jgi:hypothetical protein
VKEDQTSEADFWFTVDLLAQFFSRKRIQTTLAGIWDTGVTGWEKWWQIEFAMFLSEHDDIAEWNMEEEFHTDLRTGTAKDYMAIDICFRRKGLAANHYIFLELKEDEDLEALHWKHAERRREVFEKQGPIHRRKAGAQFLACRSAPWRFKG